MPFFIKDFRLGIARHYRNSRGWSTKRKFVVFESDDWGSINMPSPEVYESFLEAGYPVDLNKYERFDTLESNDDLELLFETLSHYKDINGNPPVITANCLVANPDFEAIKKDNYQNYHYELVTETFKRHPGRERGFDLWMDGYNNKVFKMQFHGREHVNVERFMDALKRKDEDLHFAFKHGKAGCIGKNINNIGNPYVTATRYKTGEEKITIMHILDDGLEIFKSLMGFHSESVIPTNYIWSPDFDDVTKNHGVKYYQGYRKITEPGVDGNPETIHTHFLGKKNSSGQLYLIRNCDFEPAFSNLSVVNSAIRDVAAAFRMNKPAIISTHRINFAGSLSNSNRDTTLFQLEELLKAILKRWPEIEFVSSDNLGRIIENDLSA